MPARPDRTRLSRQHGAVPRRRRFGDVHSEQLHGGGGVDLGGRGVVCERRNVVPVTVDEQSVDNPAVNGTQAHSGINGLPR